MHAAFNSGIVYSNRGCGLSLVFGCTMETGKCTIHVYLPYYALCRAQIIALLAQTK